MTRPLLTGAILMAMVSCKRSGQETSQVSDNSNDRTESKLIAPPIEGVDVSSVVMEIDPNVDQLLRPENGAGTTIRIPAGAIVDSKGNQPKGKVSLKYREFHNAAEIFVSGIPMQMKVKGGKEEFETAGMFEIRAEDQHGNPLFVKDGAGIEVRMGSFQTDKDFRFFFLDENEKNWAYQGESDPEINTERVRMEEELVASIPSHKVPFTDDYVILDYASMLDILARDDYRMVEVLQSSPKIKNKMKEFNLRSLDVSLYSAIYFRGRQYPADAIVWKVLGKDPINAGARSCNVIYLGDNKYKFDVAYYDGRTWKGTMEAVMTIQELFSKDAAFWQGQYEEAMAEVKILEEKIKEKEAVYRTFEIAGFGIYNWDRFMKKEGSKPMLVHTPVEFDRTLDSKEDLRANHFFLIGPDKNSLVRLNPGVYFKDSLMLQSLPGSMIITNLQGGYLAVLNTDAYDKIPFDRLQPKATVPLRFKVSTGKVNSPEDVEKILGI